MSGKRNKRYNNQNNDNHLRSQSMVPELETKFSNTTLDQKLNNSAQARSISTERLNELTIATNFSKANSPFCVRPDKGGKNGRSTVLKTNFYDIEIDFTKGAYHYDAEIVFTYLKKNGKPGQSPAKKSYKK